MRSNHDYLVTVSNLWSWERSSGTREHVLTVPHGQKKKNKKDPRWFGSGVRRKSLQLLPTKLVKFTSKPEQWRNVFCYLRPIGSSDGRLYRFVGGGSIGGRWRTAWKGNGH